MRLPAALVLCALLLLLSSCDDDARGIAISGDGAVALNTPERQRSKITAHIATELGTQLGRHWLAAVAIGELPEYDENFDRGFADSWYWSTATVTVELVGDGTVEMPETVQSIRDAVWDYLRRRVDRPKRNLAIAVTTHVDAVRFAALARSAAHAPAPAAQPGGVGVVVGDTAPRSAAARTYTVQAGDTLAIISSVFYGTPERWRLITQANPGLDAAHLVPGTVISIPPVPAP